MEAGVGAGLVHFNVILWIMWKTTTPGKRVMWAVLLVLTGCGVYLPMGIWGLFSLVSGLIYPLVVVAFFRRPAT